jgi:hypothetical protein
LASLEKLLAISSEDKENPADSNSDFTVTLKESYYTQNVLRVLVKEITVPNVFPNIRGSAYGSSQNNEIVISINGGPPQTQTLPEGQYLINSVNPIIDFTSNLESVLAPAIAPATISITYNELTNKIGFEMTGATLQILGSDFLNPNAIVMNDVLGITTTFQITNGAGVRYPPYQVDLSGYQNVYVHSKEIALSHAIDGDTGLISVVSPVSLVDAPFGGFAYRKNDDDELASIVYDQVRNLSRISIILRDNLGNKLDIGSHKMNIVVKCYLDSG